MNQNHIWKCGLFGGFSEHLAKFIIDAKKQNHCNHWHQICLHLVRQVSFFYLKPNIWWVPTEQGFSKAPMFFWDVRIPQNLWWVHPDGQDTVDKRNPQQPPGMLLNLENNGIKVTFPSTGYIAGFWKPSTVPGPWIQSYVLPCRRIDDAYQQQKYTNIFKERKRFDI